MQSLGSYEGGRMLPVPATGAQIPFGERRGEEILSLTALFFELTLNFTITKEVKKMVLRLLSLRAVSGTVAAPKGIEKIKAEVERNAGVGDAL